MKSHLKIFNYVSVAVLALGLSACGSGSSATPPTLASPGTVGTTTCGVQGGYVYTTDGELPQGACPPGQGQVPGQYASNGQPLCLSQISNQNIQNCNGQGIPPVNGMCTTPGTILENGLCYPQGQGGYPGMYPGQYPGQYPGVGYSPVGVGGGGNYGYPYNPINGSLGGGFYYYTYPVGAVY